jgi:hypothetical protein
MISTFGVIDGGITFFFVFEGEEAITFYAAYF